MHLVGVDIRQREGPVGRRHMSLCETNGERVNVSGLRKISLALHTVTQQSVLITGGTAYNLWEHVGKTTLNQIKTTR